MKILLSTLASFAVTGGAVAPLTMDANHASTFNNNSSVEPLKETTFDLGGFKQISINQGEGSWEFKFNLGQANQMNINKIKFHGGGLRSYVAWGSDVYDYGWPEVDVISDGSAHKIFRDDHSSGLATQTSYLQYTLSHMDYHQYTLRLDFYTQSFNSFTGSWGTLTIGDQLTFVG